GYPPLYCILYFQPHLPSHLHPCKYLGYNKVEDTQILCVVNKPDEQVIHQGMVPADSTIIWGRDLRDPTKVEYFYEEIKANTYFIVGWGYYGEDDPELTPKTWFYAAYERVE
ncbi:MAG: hypothetical protein AAFR87_23150, partial [Bacteroidota bacterium]